MAPLFSLIRDVNPSKTQWALRLRLVRCYDIPVFRNRSQIASTECVFHDREGDMIHATLKGAVMDVIKPKLIEGHLFTVKDFIVADNKIKFKTTNYKFKINFMRKTNVVEFFDPGFPNYIFNFINFAELTPEREIEEFELFDIIGRVVSYQTPTRHPGTGSTRMEFKLEDLQKRILPCTLWEEYVNYLLPYLEDRKGNHVIVIIQFGRAKLSGDDISVSNTYHATKVIVNGSAEEFKDFQNKVIEVGEVSTSISRSCNKPSFTIFEEFNSGQAVVKTIAEIKEINEDAVYWVDATIVDIETVGDFWYLASKRCSKKLIEDEKQFLCTKCNVKESTGNFRFKIEVRVDSSRNARFLLWDKECVQLLGKCTGDLKALNKNEISAIRAEIEDALTDKDALFKIQVKSDMKERNFETYNVLKLAIDKRVAAKGKEKISENEETEVVSKKTDDVTEEEVPPKDSADSDSEEKVNSKSNEEIGEGKDSEKTVDSVSEDNGASKCNVEVDVGKGKEKAVDSDEPIMKRSLTGAVKNLKGTKKIKAVIKKEK